MFTVIQAEAPQKWRHSLSRSEWIWIVWDGWDNEYSAKWWDFEEACRDAALKEWWRQTVTAPVPVEDQGTR